MADDVLGGGGAPPSPPTDDGGGAPAVDPAGGGGNAEAARYRTRLREVEAERDGVAGERDTAFGRVAALQRREAERIAAAVLAQPADLFDVAGVALADLLGADGEVDPELVQSAASSALDQRPGLGKARPPWPGLTGQGSGGQGNTPPPSWRDVLGRRS